MSRTVLVTGATGKQGGAVVDALLAQKDQNWTILAVTRNPNSEAAQKLAAKSFNVKLVEGNLDNVPDLFDAAQKISGPIWGVFSVQVSQGKGVTLEGEIKQGKAMVDESVKSGVSHFVYSSVDRGGDDVSWETETPIPHFQAKYHLDKYLKERAGDKMGWTILRPVAFMDNWQPGFPARVFMAALSNNVGTKPIQWIATSDIGYFAGLAFASPKTYNHQAISLAGDVLNVQDLVKNFRDVVNANMQPAFWMLGSLLTTLVGEMGTMVRWFGTDGYKADVEMCRKRHPSLKSFETWLKTDSPFKL
ncbi:uncharacterized protein PV09_04367 [Verruconis gallopava]|uniref:NmrA-like domain-containing protein n=1 Tax=Verruconis gallopava TaxID=253628 RepID=A0A0D2ADS5_9PEZI|nr:uncharacterized protein PV09_04367 [Verruconis gallopava]KIW04620.1 hypothetical protein PV09_04367 [Verruconis gallopava]